MSRTITVDISDHVYGLLQVLAAGMVVGYEPGPDIAARALPANGELQVEDVVLALIDHAQQGVYRPGAWERGWLEQAFGSSWQQFLEWDDRPERLAGDGRVIFQRPRRS